MFKARDAAVVGGIVLTVLLATSLGWELLRGDRVAGFHGTAFAEAGPAPAFTLTDHTGGARSLADFSGRPVLLFFGFTHCPDVCPLALQRLVRARESLGRRGRDIEILLVTVDPARDSPAVLADYVARFGPGVTGLTAETPTLEAVLRDYGAYAVPAAAAPDHAAAGHAAAGHGSHAAGPGQTLAHSDAVYGIDRAGRLRVLIAPDAPETQLRDDVAALARR